jgi:hypothetical protein
MLKKRETTTLDQHPYYLWAPLGKLPRGEYVLELFDSDRNRVRVSRVVEVPGAEEP